MKKTPLNWEQIFPDGELDTSVLSDSVPSRHTQNGTVIIALDTEYTCGIRGALENVCISYQVSIYHVEAAIYNEGVLYPNWRESQRFTLAYLLEMAFSLIGIAGRAIDGYRVILVGHFFAAELGMLKDRDQVAKRLEYIHKTVISKGALKFHWHNSNRNKISITIDIKDTMLLLPASHLSLQKAAVFVDDSKSELNAGEISNMLHLLMTDKVRFEEYAIRDSRITLKLFVKLQYYLNLLCGTQAKIYSTLSSASIALYTSNLLQALPLKGGKLDKDLMRYIFPKKDSDKGSLYLRYEDLAKRAYLGGLNAAYNIGTFNDGVYLDMDFSSAYPTVMNMLNVPDFGAVS